MTSLVCVFGLALAALALASCRCTDRDGAGPILAEAGGGGATQLAACRSACAAYSSTPCARAERGPEAQRSCVESCAAESAVAERAACGAERRAFLDCLSRAELACSEVLSAPSAALERAEGAPACAGERERLARCDAPCRHAGSVHLGDATLEGRSISAELVRQGCEDCSSRAPRGAPEGSPCEAARVCAGHCCGCGSAPGSYLARACIAGACAGRDEACREAPRATGEAACRK